MTITDLDKALTTAIRQDAFADGVEYENKRIIKLLEQASHEFEQYDFDAVGLTNAVIELIKGETSE